MKRIGPSIVSLGGTKDLSFGLTLRSAIKAEFRTAKEFARAMGITEGRVSQILKTTERLQPQTLDGILSCFVSFSHREEIFRAWSKEFESITAPDLSQDPQILLVELEQLANSRPDKAIQLLGTVRDSTLDPFVWQELTERQVHWNLRLTMSMPAIKAVDEMEEQARQRNDSVQILTALWMRGNVFRTLDSVTVKAMSGSHDEAVSYAQAVKPPGGSSLELWRDRRAQLERDFALHVLKLHERGRLSDESLEAGLGAAKRSMAMVDCPKFKYAGLEVRARMELALGRLVNAEDTLDEIEEAQYRFGTDIWEKASLTKAKIWAARGKTEEAIVLVQEISNECFQRMNYHHHRVADQLGAKLLAGL